MKLIAIVFLLVSPVTAYAQDGGINYWKDKVIEKMHYSISDWTTAALTKIFMDEIERSSSSQMVFVSLKDIVSFHPIDRPTSIDKSLKRSAVVLEHAYSLLFAGYIETDWLDKYLPSNKPIKVIQSKTLGEFLLIEGQGRVDALKNVLGKDSHVGLDVVYYATPSESAYELYEIIKARRYGAKNTPLSYLCHLFLQKVQKDE